jgi:DNA-binding Lrp family transcriptional regulator
MPTALRAATASAGNSMPPAAAFSRRWAAEDVPGMSRIAGERCSSQASAACRREMPRPAATSPQARVSARLADLLASGTMHVTTDLAPRLFGFHATAYLWLTVTPGELHQTGHTLSLHPESTFTAAVTGSANLLVTATCPDLAALYDFVTAKVGTLAAVRQVEVVPVLHRLKQAGTRVRSGRLTTT